MHHDVFTCIYKWNKKSLARHSNHESKTTSLSHIRALFYTLKRTLFRFLCWKQRHGQPNKEINSCNYIQMAMLTFAAESPRSLWLSGSWHCDSNVTLHNKWTQKQRQNCFAFRSPCKVHASPLSGRQDKSRPKPKKFKWTQFQLVQAVEACFAM